MRLLWKKLRGLGLCVLGLLVVVVVAEVVVCSAVAEVSMHRCWHVCTESNLLRLLAQCPL